VAQARTQLETVRAQLVDIGVARAQYEHAVGTIANLSLPLHHSPSPLDLALPKIPVGVPRNCSSDAPTSPPPSAAPLPPTPDRHRRQRLLSQHHPQRNRRLRKHARGTWLQAPARSGLWAPATELLFDAGQRHALTDQARHTYEAQAAAYRNSIFQAFNDVEDQLSASEF